MAIDKQSWERFLNQLRMELPGSSDTGIKEKLFDVLDEFCEYSGAWQETMTVPILAGTTTGNVSTNTTYTLTPAQDGYIIRLVGVWDSNLIPVPCFLPTFEGGPNSVGLLQLINPVNQNQNVTVTVAKTVALPTTKDDVPVFSETLFKRYHRYLRDGVMGYMQAQMGKPYTNQQLSTANLVRFKNGISTARVQVERQNTKGAQAWSYPQTFRTGGQRGGVASPSAQTF